ncbi:MAG: type II toxin-antitoxin system RelE/ParE family toxin [Nitrospirae bacterium]|nr:type II toxin-antitoxin system RelE/ParE family toxin [Nitrospirota bacterium]
MDWQLVFNNLSLPAPDQQKAYDLLSDAFQGILCLKQNNDRFYLYYDGDSIYRCTLADAFTYDDYINKLRTDNEIDLLGFINEIEDQAPCFDHIKEYLFYELSNLSPFLCDAPYGNNFDILTLVMCLDNSVMLSLATSDKWDKYTIVFCCNEDANNKIVKHEIYNISKPEHCTAILKALEGKIEDMCSDAIFSDNFIDWYNNINKENKIRIRRKIKLCCDNNFELGRPHIDTLSGSKYSNMKEIRGGTAYAENGRIRILFIRDENRATYILYGFIKHGNDYTQPIAIAEKIYADTRMSI